MDRTTYKLVFQSFPGVTIRKQKNKLFVVDTSKETDCISWRKSAKLHATDIPYSWESEWFMW